MLWNDSDRYWLTTKAPCSDDTIANTANCVALARAGGGGSVVSGASPAVTSVDRRYDDYALLSRLQQASSITAAAVAAADSASFRPPSYCTATSQMRPGGGAGATGTHQQAALGVVHSGSLHGGQASVGPAGPAGAQTALPYTVGFALSPGDMMRQPPLAGFQGTEKSQE